MIRQLIDKIQKNKGPNLCRFGPHVKLYTRARYKEGI